MAETVSFATTEDQELIASTAAQFLSERFPMEATREIMMSREGFDRGLWKEITSLGWTGIAVPDRFGGAGYGLAELGVLLEEMGRVVMPGPFLASAVMATTLVSAVGTDVQAEELLGGMAGGETIATPAVFERPRGWDQSAIDATATRAGDGWRLDGTKRYVIEGAVADVFLVAARVDDGLGVFVVPAGTDGCTVEGVPSLDATRRLATLHLSGVKLPDDALLGGGPVDGALRRTMLLWTAALACEQVGGARQCLDLSVEYAKSRHQFGRPIGSFQAVKHRCAEMLMKVEHARSVAYHAARSALDPQEMVIAAPLAGSVASEAYMWAAAETIQIHGGIGFTWEHDAHLYLKRAKTSSLMLGDAHFHRRRLGEALGL